MKTNACGFPELETIDFTSPAALMELAFLADAKFQSQESDLDYLERPEAIIVGLSAPSDYFNQTPPNGQSVSFDTTIFVSRPSASPSFGISFGPDWRPGIYVGGVNMFLNTTPPLDSIMMDLKLQDKRGPRLVNTFYQVSPASTGDSGMLAERMSAAMVFEVHTPAQASLSAFIDISNTGHVTAQTNSRMWALRLRGLSDA